MSNANILELNINSNAFENMKEDFNAVLKRTLANMQQKGSNEAALTLKLSISLDESEVRDFDSQEPNAYRRVYKPGFDHKISSVMQIKTEKSGSFNGEYELVWDEDLEDFVMKPINNGQPSFFDEDYAASVSVDATEVDVENAPALPAPNALPEAVADGYEYDKEV